MFPRLLRTAPRLRSLRVTILSAVIFVGALTFGASVARAAANSPTTGVPDRPNIVLIVTDDMGYGDCSSYWKTDLQTPFMDEIGRNGVRFTQFRVNPLCAPTRASDRKSVV